MLFTDKLTTNKMLYAICAFIVVVFAFSAAEQVPLPPITICKRNSDNYSDCLKAAIKEAWPQFVKGLPEFDFPSLDPITFEFGNAVFDNGPIHGVVNVSNFIIEGFAKTRFLGVRSHFDDKIFQLDIDIQIPQIAGSGEVNAVGILGGFRMGGNGLVNVTLEDLHGTWIMKGHVANDTWTVEDYYAAPSPKNMKVYFENLFNGNKELNDLAMVFVNEYWPLLYRIIIPIGADTWNPWLCDLVNRFFSKVSFKEIFP
ncbi:protein takeout-like [Linepithema humile]|uniref:protein takeout-like n=1 Tax=Linepithema humile TaxID=83485 RepID=UPI0006236F2B|nr:PREDICTED: circadian clock-controlled protein-like [Linepithema humile]